MTSISRVSILGNAIHVRTPVATPIEGIYASDPESRVGRMF